MRVSKESTSSVTFTQFKSQHCLPKKTKIKGTIKNRNMEIGRLRRFGETSENSLAVSIVQKA